MQRLRVALIVGALIAGPASATTITWGPATDTNGPSDVSTAGALVKAFNCSYSPLPVTVNGVPFAGEDPSDEVGSELPNAYAGFANGADLGDPSFGILLDTGRWWADDRVVMLNGLTAGSAYELQLFVMDQRSGPNDRTVTFISGANSVTLEMDPGNSGDAPFGQFVIGTFTADATTQPFTITGPVVEQVQAWQLRVVPEPSSLALLGLGVSLLVRQRRLARS